MITYLSTADEIQESGVDTVVLAIGSTEQHGPHLPIATDFIIAKLSGRQLQRRPELSFCLRFLSAPAGSIWAKRAVYGSNRTCSTAC